MTQYRQGRDAEYRAREELLRQQYHTCLRCAGSHGPVDLVAIGPEHVKFVQVKSTAQDHHSFAAELEELKAWPVPEHCQKELWVWLKSKRAWMVLPA